MVLNVPKTFVLIAGMPGSGKSIIVDVAKELNIPAYTMGDVVREETLKRYGTIAPELMVKTSKLLREEFGEDVIAVRTLERIREDHCIVLIDGVRSLKEVEFFRKHGTVVIIAVHASPGTRFKRLLERRRPGDPSNHEEFTRRDLTELGFGLGHVIALADYVIVNEGLPEEAREKARRILASLVESHGRDRC